MDLNLAAWLDLVLRWGHVFAAILWVGTTYYFTWLDGRFARLEKSAGQGGDVWMVHSGGFYVVQKQKSPKVMPEKLHWFKWEAALTWLTGLLLFILLYYHGGLLVSVQDEPPAGPTGFLAEIKRVFLLVPGPISKITAIWLSIGLLVASVPVYELVWTIIRNQVLGAIVSFGLIVAFNWWLAHLFHPRAAYLQLGAMFGTIMAANVWMRILPAQHRMVAALKAGEAPDQNEVVRAKACSRHNTYIVVPVVIMMLSQHFPTLLYGSGSWMVLSALVLVGWGAARILRRA